MAKKSPKRKRDLNETIEKLSSYVNENTPFISGWVLDKSLHYLNKFRAGSDNSDKNKIITDLSHKLVDKTRGYEKLKKELELSEEALEQISVMNWNQRKMVTKAREVGGELVKNELTKFIMSEKAKKYKGSLNEKAREKMLPLGSDIRPTTKI